jgi:uncharacterized protein (TIGR00255 family)
MLISMTGFGSKEGEIPLFGKVSVELRSTNHKFFEVVLHMPEGFLSLEDRIKKEIEAKAKRGRITCVININGSKAPSVFINEKLLKNYLFVLGKAKRQFQLTGEVGLGTLIQLPGVLALTESSLPKEKIWPGLRVLLKGAVDNFAKTRQKEGRALYMYLKSRGQILKTEVGAVQARFKGVVGDKTAKMKTSEERNSFLKDTDITEEIERLSFHIKNFNHKLNKSIPVGKELDFIAQEMQREANTIAAKSCDSVLSVKVIHIKSQIEKIREQVQNIE